MQTADAAREASGEAQSARSPQTHPQMRCRRRVPPQMLLPGLWPRGGRVRGFCGLVICWTECAGHRQWLQRGPAGRVPLGLADSRLVRPSSPTAPSGTGHGASPPQTCQDSCSFPPGEKAASVQGHLGLQIKPRWVISRRLPCPRPMCVPSSCTYCVFHKPADSEFWGGPW